MRSAVQPNQQLDEEQVVTVATTTVSAEVVIEEDTSPPMTLVQQVDTLSATPDALACLLSPGDQSRSLPGPPPPSPEVPSRSIASLPTRSLDNEVSAAGDGSDRRVLANACAHPSCRLACDVDRHADPRTATPQTLKCLTLTLVKPCERIRATPVLRT